MYGFRAASASSGRKFATFAVAGERVRPLLLVTYEDGFRGFQKSVSSSSYFAGVITSAPNKSAVGPGLLLVLSVINTPYNNINCIHGSLFMAISIRTGQPVVAEIDKEGFRRLIRFVLAG